MKTLLDVLIVNVSVHEEKRHQIPHEHLSLKVQNVEFDISVPPGKMYIENLTLKISMRPHNSVQMSISC